MKGIYLLNGFSVKHNLHKSTNTRIYKAVIRPISTYASETRADTSRTKQILETNEMNILRKIVHKTRRDKVRSEEIRRQLNIQAIGDWVDRRRTEWNQYVSRMTSDRIVPVARDSFTCRWEEITWKTEKEMVGLLSSGWNKL
mgnify:CR=1 FL=1